MPPPPSTSSTTSSLTPQLCRESSGDDTLPQITTLICRGLALNSIPSPVATSLSSLTTLSLSHNEFTSLVNFRHLSSLKDLNLNFNRLSGSSLSELSDLQHLKSLYLSSNSLDDSSLKVLAAPSSFPVLTTLSMFKNNLTSVSELRDMLSNRERLRDVTFEGNEVASVPGYKGVVLRGGKCIEVLDGEELEDVDYEMAEMADSGADNSNKMKLDLSKLGTGAPSASAAAASADAHRAHGAQASLNSDPVLLTYRAAEILNEVYESDPEEGRTSEREKVFELARELEKNRKQKRSFVGKLRGNSVSTGNNSNANNNANSNSNSARGGESDDDADMAADLVRAAAMLNVKEATLSDFLSGERKGAAQVSLDMNDPWEILRKLLVKCEGLEEENKKMRRHQMQGGALDVFGSDAEELRKELEDLRMENANMYLLREENKSIKTEIEGLKMENEGLRMKAGRGAEGGHSYSDTRDTYCANKGVPGLDLAFKGAWGDGGGSSGGGSSGDGLPAYPDVGIPTPRSSCSSSRSGSRPSTARSRPSSAKALYEEGGVAGPGTASERIESGYLQRLREEAGLGVDNPNDEVVWEDEGDEEDVEILNLIERNETGLAKIRRDLVEMKKEEEEKENRDGKDAGGEKKRGGGGMEGLSVRQLLEMRKANK